MIKSVFPASALLIGSLAFAFAAGGSAGGGTGGTAGAASGAHPSAAAHRGSSFENNPIPGVTTRPGCLGAVAGVPSAGAPWPMAPPSKTNPSPTNGSAVEGAAQSNPELPRMTQQDERTIEEIKQANEKLGTVGNPTNGQTKNRQPGQRAKVVDPRKGIERETTGSFQPLFERPPGDASAVKEMTDLGSVQDKPDVSRMSEQSQSLAREIIRETDKLGKVGNPGSGNGRSSQAQGDSLTGPSSDPRRDTNGPDPPTSTIGTASKSGC
jgi:hypothetical protein